MKISHLPKSLSYALSGLKHVFFQEPNFQVQLASAIVALVMMIGFPLSWNERIVILLLIFAVLILEIVNSAVEQLVDLVKPRLSPQVKLVKDMMAAAVLSSSIAAIIIGSIIFIPYLLELLPV